MKLEEKVLEQEVQQQQDREFQNLVFSNVNGHLHYLPTGHQTMNQSSQFTYAGSGQMNVPPMNPSSGFTSMLVCMI